MDKNEKIRKKLYSFRGEVLNECIEIENWLTLIILNYYFPKYSKKKKDFWAILDHLSFEQKVSTFENISFYKKSKFTSIKDSIRYIQRLRNKLAHWVLIKGKSNEEDIILQHPNKIVHFHINDNSVKEFHHNAEILKLWFEYDEIKN